MLKYNTVIFLYNTMQCVKCVYEHGAHAAIGVMPIHYYVEPLMPAPVKSSECLLSIASFTQPIHGGNAAPLFIRGMHIEFGGRWWWWGMGLLSQ